MPPTIADRLVASACAGVLFALLLLSWVGAATAQPPAAAPESLSAFRFEAGVRLVTLTISVSDKKGVGVRGLDRSAFQVFESGKAQDIVDFRADENAPASVVILIDTSGSMVDKLDESADALKHFAAAMNGRSEFALYEFNSFIRLVQDFTSDRRRIGAALEGLEAADGTAMYDAIDQGIAGLRRAHFERKAILLITDGNDTASQMSFEAVRKALQSTEAVLYAIGIGHSERGSFGHGYTLGSSQDEVNGSVLNDLTSDLGGRAMIVKGQHRVNGRDVIDAAALQVADELYYQYVVSYVPSEEAAPGEWREITVKVRDRDLRVRARRGYRRSSTP